MKKIILILVIVLVISTTIVNATEIDGGLDIVGTTSWTYGWADTIFPGLMCWAAVELYHDGTLVAQNSNTNIDYVYTQTSIVNVNATECSVHSLHQAY